VPHEIRNILLLDDDRELADTLKQLLEANNFIVTLASNGVEGLREVMEMDFDVIVCDLMMPKMPGDMFYLAVQRVKPHLCSRFIFITGYVGNPKVDAFLETAQGAVLEKPIAIMDLVRTIGLVFNRKPGQTQPLPSVRKV